MQVAITEDGLVHTTDEQGLVERTLEGLIFHAANRYACEYGGKLFLKG